MIRLRPRCCVVLAAMASAMSGTAFAESPAAWPCAAVTFVVPFPPGGSSDLLARQLAPGATD